MEFWYHTVVNKMNISMESKCIMHYMFGKAGPGMGSSLDFPDQRVYLHDIGTVDEICEELNVSKGRWYKHSRYLIELDILECIQSKCNGGRYGSVTYVINVGKLHHYWEVYLNEQASF